MKINPKRYTLNPASGFTLFETIISIGLLLLIVGSLGGFVGAILNARSQTSSIQEVDGNIRLALDVIGNRIRGARGVNQGASTFGSDPGVLSLDMADPAVNPTLFSLTSDNGQIQMQEGAGSPVLLTTGDVRVSNFIFTLYAPVGRRENIGIALTASYAIAVQSSTYYEHAIQTAVSLRQ